MSDPTDSELREACRRENSGKPWLWNGFARDLAFDMIARALPAKLDRIAELETEVHQWEESDAARSVLEPVFTDRISELETQLRVAREAIEKAPHLPGCPTTYRYHDFVEHDNGDTLCAYSSCLMPRYHWLHGIPHPCNCWKSDALSALSPQKER